MSTANFNILVIDDDPLVLEDSILMYQEMIHLGDLKGIFGEDSQGTVSGAKNTREAEAILKDNFTRDPHLIEVLHVDERMPDERGSEFVDRMRWVYAGRRIGALLVTGYATDVSVINSREKGVYRYLSKPVTSEGLRHHLRDLVGVIFSKEKPTKRAREKPFVFRVIQDKAQYRDYLTLRYAVYDFMNYIPPEIKMPRSRLELDKFDPYAIPFGGFEISEGKEKIVAVLRLILREPQRPYSQWIREILIENGESAMEKGILIEPKVSFPTEENYVFTELYEKGPMVSNSLCEIGRCITHFDYRGLDLSRTMIEMCIAYATEKGLHYGIGGCAPQHAVMYSRYGYKPLELSAQYLNNDSCTIKDGKLLYFETVAQVGHIMFGNFADLPEPTGTNVVQWRTVFRSGIYEKCIR